jgi:hypothetical protein
MKRSRAILLAVIVTAEGLMILTHPKEAQAVMRMVYDSLWTWAPKPAGYVPPQRF